MFKLLDLNDKSLIRGFFNSNGYVLNFTDAEFQRFTTDSVGFSVKDKYPKKNGYSLSKGKAFDEFVNNEDDELILKLTGDLVKYIEVHDIELDESQKKQLPKLKALLVGQGQLTTFSDDLTKSVAEMFNDDYIHRQMQLMKLSTSPSDVITKAKNLVESCLKAILDEQNEQYSKTDKISNLQKKVFTLLNLDAKENNAAQKDDNVKTILNSLNQIIVKLTELRNNKGNGHGVGKGFVEPPHRHGVLAMNSALTLVDFIWATYNDKYKNSK